jgi:hypothetical protein
MTTRNKENTMKRFWMYSICAACLWSAGAPAQEADTLEFMEGFAWRDRQAALKTLTPHTDDFFYFSALDRQLAGDADGFDQVMRQWLQARHQRWNARMTELRRRQRLLDFQRKPDELWKFLREDAHLRFDHRPRHERQTVRYPSRIDPQQYAVGVFEREAGSGHDRLDRVTERGLERLVGHKLSDHQRRALLGRLTRPDYAGLTDLVLADLAAPHSRGFGHHAVHRLMTGAQLEELGRRRPALLRDAAYVTERLARIPKPDADLEHDYTAAERYSLAQWEFAQTLDSMHNSLKAAILHRLLEQRRRRGLYDETLFRQYIALPRRTPYLPPARAKQWNTSGTQWVDFRFRPEPALAIPPIVNETPLVREYLIALLHDAANPAAFQDHFESRWLNAVFAESKILHGVGKPEDWASFLTPAAYRAILERVELNFAPQNPAYIRPGTPVELAVDVKRVDRILLKIHEIQTFNYYTTRRAPVDQAVDLDGMIAAHEKTIEGSSDPARRIRQTIALPEIAKRGVYVVELIGGGVSSRVLLHVGRLEAVTQPLAGGLAALVLNDAGETVRNAAIWLDGREFAANEQGLILLPFSEKPGVRFAVLRDGAFCSAEQIRQPAETYVFSAGIHLDPHNLVRRGTGVLALRPDLRIHGIPLDPALLKSVEIVLTAVDAKNTRAERRYTAEFARHAEWSAPFHVPDDLRRLEVRVEAKLQRQSDLEKITLTDEFALDVNAGRAGQTLRQLFASPSAQGWHIELRGLNGEVYPDTPLSLHFHHAAYTRPVHVQATTDARGRVALGSLDGLQGVVVQGPDNLRLDLQPDAARAVYPERIHLRPAETVSLPYPYATANGLRAFSLFRMQNGKLLEDMSEHVGLQDGAVVLSGLTAGRYELTLHEAQTRIAVEALDGPLRNGFLLGEHRRLQQTDTQRPSIAATRIEDDAVFVTLRHALPSLRVAARALRYAADDTPFPAGAGGSPRPRTAACRSSMSSM